MNIHLIQGSDRHLSDCEDALLNSELGRRIFLAVADFNPNAKRFYEKNGYVQVGRIEGLYRTGVAENIMMKCCEN